MCGKDGTGMTTKEGGLIRTCAPRQDLKKWSTFVATKCTQGSPEKPGYVRREKHPGWAETDKGQRGKPNVRARWVAKKYKTRKARVTRANAARGAESCVVGGRHGHA